MTDLKAAAEAAKAALPNMEWTAHMDRLHLVASPKGSTCLSDEVTLALCATGEHVYRVLPYLAAANPSAVLALYAERDEALAAVASGAYDAALKAHQGVYTHTVALCVERMRDAQARAEAAEAALASYKEEVERLRRVLAEARDDMQAWQGYAPDYFRDKHDADGDLAKIDQALTKEPPHAE